MGQLFTKTGDKTGNIEIEQGADYILGFALTINGSAWDLTNYVIRAAIRDNLGPSSTKLTDFMPNWVNQSGGKFTIGLTATQTAALPFTGNTHLEKMRYEWSMELVSPSGGVTRLCHGFAMLCGEATK